MTVKNKHGKKVRLLLTDRSLQDITEIEEYSIKQWGKSTAAKYLLQIEDSLSLIKDNPGLLRTETGFPEHLKFYCINKRVLVFDVQSNDIILLTLFHGSIDILSRLIELQPTLAEEVKLLHQRLVED
ncbi:MAG: hypothetical protein COA78_21725 [Blastopirellula sp.]|nr:MAG: hypothetical protein COA78_21725 [Blastopirellula sp.]